ncbi:hypothetical protein Tco_0468701 [Tanacetum coccineum]
MLLRCHRSLRCRYPLRATIRRLRDDGDNESRMRVLERLNSNFLNLQIREYCLLFKLNARFLAGQAGSGIVVSVLHLAFLAISCFDKGEVCVFLGFGSTMNPLLMFASPTLSASEMTKCVCAMMTSTTNNALFRGVPRRASQPRHTCGCSRLGQGQQHGNQFKRNQVSNPSRSFTTKHKAVACPADADCSLDIWLAVSGLKVRLYSRVEIIPNEHDIKITRSCVLLGVTLDCCFATLYAYAKCLMGSGFSDSTVQKDIRSWPFIVVEGYADNFCPHGTSCKKFRSRATPKTLFLVLETAKGMMGKKYNEDAELHKLKANVRQSGRSTCATLLRPTCPSPAWFKDHFINLLYVYA